MAVCARERRLCGRRGSWDSSWMDVGRHGVRARERLVFQGGRRRRLSFQRFLGPHPRNAAAIPPAAPSCSGRAGLAGQGRRPGSTTGPSKVSEACLASCAVAHGGCEAQQVANRRRHGTLAPAASGVPPCRFTGGGSSCRLSVRSRCIPFASWFHPHRWCGPAALRPRGRRALRRACRPGWAGPNRRRRKWQHWQHHIPALLVRAAVVL